MHVPCVSLHYNMYLGHKIMFFTGQSIWCIIYNFTLEIHWNLQPPFLKVQIPYPLLDIHWFFHPVYKAQHRAVGNWRCHCFQDRSASCSVGTCK